MARRDPHIEAPTPSPKRKLGWLQLIVPLLVLLASGGLAFFTGPHSPPSIPPEKTPSKTAGLGQTTMDCPVEGSCSTSYLRYQVLLAKNDLARLEKVNVIQPISWLDKVSSSKKIYFGTVGGIFLIVVVSWLIARRRPEGLAPPASHRLTFISLAAALVALGFATLNGLHPGTLSDKVNLPGHLSETLNASGHDQLVKDTHDRLVLDPLVDSIYYDASPDRAAARAHVQRVLDGIPVAKAEADSYHDSDPTHLDKAKMLNARFSLAFSFIKNGTTWLLMWLVWALRKVLEFALFIPLVGVLGLSPNPTLRRIAAGGLGVGVLCAVDLIALSSMLATVNSLSVRITSWLSFLGSLKWFVSTLALLLVCLIVCWIIVKMAQLSVRAVKTLANLASPATSYGGP